MSMWALATDTPRAATKKVLASIVQVRGTFDGSKVSSKLDIRFVPDETVQTVKDWMLVVARAELIKASCVRRVSW